jgi:dCMP deaminase
MNDTLSLSRSLLMKWDKRFLRIAQEISTWSKDPSKQIGAVIVNSDKRILATGYNGFPKGIDDAEEKYDNRELKYELIVHAEMNAIYNATFNGISLKDSTLYVWGLPVCSECAKGIIQVGINRVVMSASNVPQRWIDSFEKTQALFEEAEVDWTFS